MLSSPTPRGRYAPSPTGPLHLGNLRTALASWLHIRLMHGTFVLRVEDLDTLRAVDGCAQQMLDDLRWLGLDWDEGPDVGGPYGPYTQSERLDIYDEVLSQWINEQLVFPCFCSRKDIRAASSAPHGASSSLYPGTCRHLSTPEIQHTLSTRPERAPSWRLRIPTKQVDFTDGFYGPQSQNLASEVGDFILKRRDGFFAYQLAVVVDDAFMRISDVLRGQDLLDSTPRQIHLFELLDMTHPHFWHVPLMLDDHGQKLSKRDGAASLNVYREQGQSSEQLIGLLAMSLGLQSTSAPISAHDLLQSLSLDTFTSSIYKSLSS